jgi:hypothetical protein
LAGRDALWPVADRLWLVAMSSGRLPARLAPIGLAGADQPAPAVADRPGRLRSALAGGDQLGLAAIALNGADQLGLARDQLSPAISLAGAD